jgi:hypothetical protein
MYDREGRETLDEVAGIELIEQLKRDESGELRDRLVDELHVAAQDIEAALVDEPAAEQAAILRELLEVVRLSGNVLTETWESVRG